MFVHVPNTLSFIRFCSAICILPCFLVEGIYSSLSIILFIVACITDFLDGYVARKYNVCDTQWFGLPGYKIDCIADLVTILVPCITFVLIHQEPSVMWSGMLVICGITKMLCFTIRILMPPNPIASFLYDKPVLFGRNRGQVLFVIEISIIGLYLACKHMLVI